MHRTPFGPAVCALPNLVTNRCVKVPPGTMCWREFVVTWSGPGLWRTEGVPFGCAIRGRPFQATLPICDATITMEPPPAVRMHGTAYLLSRNALVRLTDSARFQSSRAQVFNLDARGQGRRIAYERIDIAQLRLCKPIARRTATICRIFGPRYGLRRLVTQATGRRSKCSR